MVLPVSWELVASHSSHPKLPMSRIHSIGRRTPLTLGGDSPAQALAFCEAEGIGHLYILKEGGPYVPHLPSAGLPAVITFRHIPSHSVRCCIPLHSVTSHTSPLRRSLRHLDGGARHL